MKRPLFILFALVIINFFLMPACSDDKDGLVSISGTWITNHSVTDVPLRIKFDCCDGTFRWEPRVETDQHSPSTGSYSFMDEVLRIMDDVDCLDITGVYSAIIDGDVLEITVQEDECDPRIAGMTGTWTRE